jgi:hypothetical protein
MAKFESNSEATRLGYKSSFLDQEIAKRARVIYRNGDATTFVISLSLEGCLELEGEAPAGFRARHVDKRVWEANAE